MIERLVDPAASNWVDRGEDAEKLLVRLLEHYVPRGALTTDALAAHATAIRGMVEADSSDYQVAGYVALIERDAGVRDASPSARRTLAIALWHTAKCAEIRDRARRLIDFGIRPGPPPRRRSPIDAWYRPDLVPSGPPPGCPALPGVAVRRR